MSNLIDLYITPQIKAYAAQAANETHPGAMILSGFLEGVEAGEWRFTDPRIVFALKAAGFECKTREIGAGAKDD